MPSMGNNNFFIHSCYQFFFTDFLDISFFVDFEALLSITVEAADDSWRTLSAWAQVDCRKHYWREIDCYVEALSVDRKKRYEKQWRDHL
jgi:hypothetical protein